MRIFFSLICGIIFGIGLTLAGMLNPSKVQGFLNVFGNWDPSLAFVMIGGILVTLVGYKIILKRKRPLYAKEFSLPTQKKIDLKLLVGCGLFGVGWAISGLCPGPVLSNLLLQPQDALMFLSVMIFGLWLGEKIKKI